MPLSLPVIFCPTAAAVASHGSKPRRALLCSSRLSSKPVSCVPYRLADCGIIGTRRKSLRKKISSPPNLDVFSDESRQIETGAAILLHVIRHDYQGKWLRLPKCRRHSRNSDIFRTDCARFNQRRRVHDVAEAEIKMPRQRVAAWRSSADQKPMSRGRCHLQCAPNGCVPSGDPPG